MITLSAPRFVTTMEAAINFFEPASKPTPGLRLGDAHVTSVKAIVSIWSPLWANKDREPAVWGTSGDVPVSSAFVAP